MSGRAGAALAALGHASLRLAGGTSPDRRAHTLTSFPGHRCRKLFGCSLPPSYTLFRPTSGLLLQPCPPPASLCQVPGDAPEHRLVRPWHPAVPCPPPTSGVLSPPPEAWKGPGRTRPFTHHSHRTPHTHHHPMREKKIKNNKKIFCTEIYFYYTKFVQYQKRKKKKM